MGPVLLVITVYIYNYINCNYIIGELGRQIVGADHGYGQQLHNMSQLEYKLNTIFIIKNVSLFQYIYQNIDMLVFNNWRCSKYTYQYDKPRTYSNQLR